MSNLAPVNRAPPSCHCIFPSAPRAASTSWPYAPSPLLTGAQVGAGGRLGGERNRELVVARHEGLVDDGGALVDYAPLPLLLLILAIAVTVVLLPS